MIHDLTTRQANMNAFVENVLYNASKGAGVYGNIETATKNAAAALYQEFGTNLNISGNVIGVDVSTGEIHISRWERWK